MVRLVLVPVLLTVAVAVVRFLGQVWGWIPTESGGGLHLLGIVWLPFVFGPWFARRLLRDGPGSRWGRWRAAAVSGLLALVVLVSWMFAPLADAPPGPVTAAATSVALRTSFTATLVVTAALAAMWWRLAWTLVCYAVPVRLTVILLTWIAKTSDFDTHYTKFGPSGEEHALPKTMALASVAQLGFWVPFAVVCGFVGASLFARRPAERAA